MNITSEYIERKHSDDWGDHTVYVGKDDFCSYGKRKEGAEQ